MSATIIPHISVVLSCGSAGFICGIWLQSFQLTSYENILFGVFLLCIFLITGFLRSQKMWMIVIFLLLFCCGSIVFEKSMNFLKQESGFASREITRNARVVREVEKKTWLSAVYVQFDELDSVILLRDDYHTSLKVGDRIFLTCTLEIPQSFSNFDYRMFLAMKDVFLTCEDSRYEIIGHESSFRAQLSQWRNVMESIIKRLVSAPHSALANGLLFGGGERLSENLQEDFSRTGMTHIVAVSGYNVSVIIVVVLGVLIYFGFHRIYAIIFAIGAVVFFVAIIGFPSSGIRAAIMGSLVLIAAVHGRVAHAYGAVLFSAAIMLLFNPFLLRYDIGFQLSFLATIGIIMFYPICEKLFIKKYRAFGLFEIIFLTLAAQILVIPVIIYHFHTLPVLSLLVNLLVLPIIPVTMFLAVLIVVFHYIFIPFSIFFSWLVYWLLEYEIFIISFFADISWSSFEVGSLNVWMIMGYYFFIVGLYIIYYKKYE